MQLSPIQCTYSNIFIRFFKFFPANTNIYQNSYRVIVALCGLRQGVLSSQCGHLISFGTKYLMSLYPLGAHCTLCHSEELHSNDVRIPRKGHHITKSTQDTLRHFKREPIKISIQFVCKLQSIFFYIPKSTALYFHIICTCIYIY